MYIMYNNIVLRLFCFRLSQNVLCLESYDFVQKLIFIKLLNVLLV